MKNTLEVVFGLSCYYSIKLSNLNKNIINFDAPLNFSDLSQINQNKLIIPKGIGEEEVYYLDNILNKINSAVDKGLKIRIWTSHEDVCCHLMLLYICNLLISRNANIYVIYTEDYDKDCYS